MSQLRFTLIQTELFWENKNSNLFMLERKINALQEPTHVILLPEMFSTGFSMKPAALAENMDGESVQWMKRIAVQKKIILAGSLIIEENGHYYNRLIWMQPDGRYGFYDKRHLFAFAEEDKYYSAGSQRLIASVNGWKINLLVCYDLRFPVWSRQCAEQTENKKEKESEAEYDVLVYVANWPDKRSLAWKTLLRARAIENQCYVIGVNRVGKDGNDIVYNGDSMVIDPLGETLYQKTGEEDVCTITLDKEVLNQARQRFPFLKDADDFRILV
ncbi:MAG: amidohydrolase [Flavisolibacter sp.]